jgi:molecular chaperone GrpE
MSDKAHPVEEDENVDVAEVESERVDETADDSVESASQESQTDEETDPAEELQLLLEDARAKADQHWEQLLRLQAELANTHRRAKRDIENAHKFGLEKFANELLPVKDSLELGLSVVADSDSDEKLREGTELTLRMLTNAMEKFGIREVDPTDEAFNPELHQAMTMQESADHKSNTVIAVMQKGYTLNERLIRPAMVVVSK